MPSPPEIGRSAKVRSTVIGSIPCGMKTRGDKIIKPAKKQKRQPMKPVSYLLRNEKVRTSLIALLPTLPLDDENPIQCLIREVVKVRSDAQNALYWVRLDEISEQAWLFNRQYPAIVWHHHCCRVILPNLIKTKDGCICSKYIETPDSSTLIISTTQLETECFGEYITKVEVFGAELGVQFSVNPRT